MTELLCWLLLFVLSPAHAQPSDALLLLVRAYPDALAGVDGTTLIWRDGTRMAADDGNPDKPPAEALRHGSILDMLRQPYVIDDSGPPAADPGRVRNQAFFDKLYGDCRRGEVAPHLVAVAWLPRHGGHVLRVTALHGVADALDAVSHELDMLPDADMPYLIPPAGGYLCRAVAATGAPSMHARGAAIDIDARLSDFWGWQRGAGDPPPWRNHVPLDIVHVFERHGFIWGGRWAHFDTMHFEYRPELLPPGRAP